MPWPTSNHESPDVDLSIPNVTAPHYLWSILRADNQEFRADDYSAVRQNISDAIALFGQGQTGGQKPTAEVSEQRLRTWKKAFEDMGILTVRDDRVHATRFGRSIIDGWSRIDDALRGANERIALLGAEVANRVLLLPPHKELDGVPADADLHPIRAIWRSFRSLDNRLHWQDINRVLGNIHYESELPNAIARIRDYRDRYGGQYNAQTLEDLGPSPISHDPRHITPWLNRASVGGLLFPSEADANGFRPLSEKGRQIIDELLAQTPPSLPAGATPNDYLQYLMAPVERHELPVSEEDSPLVERVVDAATSYGRSKFITLSGLPGTGKTRLARLAADRIVGGDQSRLKEIQFHESVSYEDFVEGFVPRRDGSGFELRPKVLRTINDRARSDPHQTYVLLIEEFTRANAHAVLGELLTYVEHRDRTFQWSSSQEVSMIAPNLVIITTMNPRDKSALQLDMAVKRRMHIIDVPSSADALSSMLLVLPDADRAKVVEWFRSHEGTLPFGHGLFADVKDIEGLRKVWRGTVAPLLRDATGSISSAYLSAYEEFPFA